jgi:hypothetical protein
MGEENPAASTIEVARTLKKRMKIPLTLDETRCQIFLAGLFLVGSPQSAGDGGRELTDATKKGVEYLS